VSRVPIAEGLFTLDDQPTLLGGRCSECGAYTFPVREGCPRCGASAVEPCELGGAGTLYSWTSQGFAPKAPFRGEWASRDGFAPWYVGLVEIPDTLRVEALLVGVQDEKDLEFDMPVRLVLTPFRNDPETGDEVVTFAFAPAGEGTTGA
jgi:uncharacterized OB-fold protein